MNNFESYLSRLKIHKICKARDVINFLVRERLKITKKRWANRHKKSIDSKSAYLPLIQRICPPRRQWSKYRPNKNQRKDLSRSEIQAKCLAECITRELERPLNQSAPWVMELIKTIDILNDQYVAGETMEFPRLIPMEKPADPTKPDTTQYRVIVVQENFIDRMLHSLVARYLQKTFRKTYSKNVYGMTSTRSASTAVSNLISFRNQHVGKVLWCSEVDIRQFFDTVSHKKVEESLTRHINQHFSSDDPIEPEALIVLRNFLKNYSHQKVETILYERMGIDSLMPVDLKNPLKEMDGKFGYGIPQGSPFSILIANVLMTAADTVVEKEIDKAPDDGFYARFVDDVIMVQQNKATCEKMHHAYLKALESLGLFPHPPSPETSTHPKDYLDQKTHLPYPWCHSTEEKGAHRWVAFLGYHIREDLQIRLRQSTFEKEIEKHKKIVNEVLAKLSHPSYLKWRRKEELRKPWIPSLLFIAEKRLVARTVGLDVLQGKFHLDQRFCWNAAFPHLRASIQGATQLRQLDKNREKQIRRLQARLKELDLSVSWPEWYKTCRFFGHPFSYYSLVQNKEKASHPKLHNDRFFFDTAY